MTTNASKALTVEKLSQVMTLEACGTFDARAAIPGHIQQGGKPSPIDRTKATRLAIKAVTFIESNQVVTLEKCNTDQAYDDTFDKKNVFNSCNSWY